MSKQDNEKIERLLTIRGEFMTNEDSRDNERQMSNFPGKDEAIRNAVSHYERLLLSHTLDVTFKALRRDSAEES